VILAGSVRDSAFMSFPRKPESGLGPERAPGQGGRAALAFRQEPAALARMGPAPDALVQTTAAA
jgi:hypothetical protein